MPVAGRRHHAHWRGSAKAQDVVQEAFARLVPRLSTVGGYDDPEAWVRKVALRPLSNRFRQRRPLRAPSAADERELPPPGDTRADVLKALARSPMPQRRVVVQHYLQDLTIDTVDTVAREVDPARRHGQVATVAGAARTRPAAPRGRDRPCLSCPSCWPRRSVPSAANSGLCDYRNGSASSRFELYTLPTRQAARPSPNQDVMSTAPYDPNDPLGRIIRLDQMRGLNSELEILDPDALADSLIEAGLHEAQATALRRSDLSLETYVSLINLEMGCLRSNGIEPGDMKVSTLEYGLQQPTYGYPSEVPGLTSDELACIQIDCQNRFTGAYQPLYAAKFAPSVEEALARDMAAANAFLECARDKGFKPPIDVVQSPSDFEVFYTWYSTPEADIDCGFNP